MEPRIDIWNVLHDGEITVVARDGDDLVLFVSIPYLRVKFAPLGDSFSIRLKGFRSFTSLDDDGNVKGRDPLALSLAGFEILGADPRFVPARVEMTMGVVVLDYDSIDVALDTGQAVTYAELHTLATQYWNDLSAKREANEQSSG